ncbi:MAG: sigma-70 family RNA polymerase sigma factor [Gammaproteobacteria bacterium]|nr:sigma-70 family RNA polymerase sigma factor [Gammaproteobacteria bacterium]
MSNENSKFSLFGQFGRRRRLRSQICAEQDRLYRIAWSWCHDSCQAEDLVQETLARALSKVDNLHDEQRLQVWLTRILANLHRDHYRRTRPESSLEGDALTAEDDPEYAACRSQLIALTRQAVALLGQDQRQVLTLVDIAQFSYADTATILGLPVGTVMSRLSRARRRMRELLEQRGIGDADVVPLRRHR